MERINIHKVVPVVVINSIEETVPTLKALSDGGLPIAEITYRTSCARDAIALAIKEFPDMLIGAGTVVDVQQAEEAIALGCKFIVSPGYQSGVSAVCMEKSVPYFPGCVTPTEIMMAINDGWKTIKFFPASVYGGLKAMKALAGPFPQINFIPTGGVSEVNMLDFLSWDRIVAVGGSWMVSGSYDEIVAKCKTISDMIK